MIRLTAVTLVVFALLAAAPTGAAAQGARGSVDGEVTDTSGGVLPGVTVVAVGAGGQLLTTTVTDGSGRYELRALPAGRVTLTFDLAGFSGASVVVAVPSGARLRHVQRLALGSVSETVDVRALAPAAPPRPVPPPAPPPPVLRPVPPHDRDSICGPSKPGPSPEAIGTIRSAREPVSRGLFGRDAQVVIDGGLSDGLEVGRNLIVRRHYRAVGMTRADTIAEHSAGLIQIVSADDHASVGVAVYVCDELRTGDFLVPFAAEPIRDTEAAGVPAYYDASRILFADEGQILGVPRRMMVIDRGSSQGLHVGQRFTLFRRGRDAARPEALGDATVVAVRSDSATVRIDRATDAISAGDWAAPQTTRR